MNQLIATLSNAPHLHLILNHVPTVGFGIALALFVLGQMRKSDDLRRAGLVLFFCVAVLSIATYVTGNAASASLEDPESASGYRGYVAPEAIGLHEDAALLAFAFMEITGFAAWLALWRWRRVNHLASAYFNGVLLLSVVTFGLMARAAEFGGAIHHPEILGLPAIQAPEGSVDSAQSPEAPPANSAASAPSPDAELGTPSKISQAGWVRKALASNFVDDKVWVWPTLETLHFVGLSMLFGVVLIVNLRVLGMIKSVSYAAVDQLLPAGVLGFGVNLITGMLFFIGKPDQYVHNTVFYWKIVLIVMGGLNLVYFMLDDNILNVKAGDDASVVPKIAAASSIFIWVGVIFCGHMLPFLGNAF